VPYLPSRPRRLGIAFLAHEPGLHGLASRLSAWGLVGGGERDFQGDSRRLQVVVSRTLDFRSAAGAAAFARYVHDHAAAWFGALPTIRPLVSNGRSGYSYAAQACACPHASPALWGVVRSAARISWLELNGPRADAAALRRLLRRAP
jgi:hypothetical protein